MILAISWTTPLLARAPHVEPDFSVMSSDDWMEERSNKIFPADQIRRIVRVGERGFGRDSGPSGEQADYDALFAHLLDSTATATGRVLGGNEGTLAGLAALAEVGEILRIEAVGTPGTPSSPTAILVHGEGRVARIGRCNAGSRLMGEAAG